MVDMGLNIVYGSFNMNREELSKEAFIGIRLPSQEKQQLEKMAKKQRTKLSKIVRRAIRQLIDSGANGKSAKAA